jgi:hypothetical protein
MRHLVTAALFVSATIGCSSSKVIPSPWQEAGVPAEHLVEISAATDGEHFVGTYDLAPVLEVEAFRASIQRHGYVPCGNIVSNDPTSHTTLAFFKKDGQLWWVAAEKASGEQSIVQLRRPQVWDGQLMLAGCSPG